MNRMSEMQFSGGLFSPKRAMTLEVPGRRTGRVTSFPVVVADYHGERYLVSMLGNDANGMGASEHPHVELCVPRLDADRSDLAGVPPGQSCRTGHRLAGPTGDGEQQRRAGSTLPAPWACPSMVTCPGRVSATRAGGSER